MRIPIAKDGFPIIIPPLVIGVFFWKILNWEVGVPFLVFGLFSMWFFRDPTREVPFHSNAIVSPADGTVIKIDNVKDDKYLMEETKKISIFMSIFDVHVNRIPFDGVVADIRYNPGKFLVASRDKASEVNEQNAVVIDTNGNGKIAFVHLNKGDEVLRGERFGMIRFGSRLDVYLPKNVQISVLTGDKVKAGKTILGYF